MEHKENLKYFLSEYNAMLAKHGLQTSLKIKPAKLTWSSKIRRFVFAANKVFQYLKAECNHALNGAVSNTDSKRRLDTCMTCEHRAVEYKGMIDPAGVGYCAGGCGCGVNGRAQLQIKVTIEGATCPRGKWKTSVHTAGGSLESVKQAIAGISSTAFSESNNARKKILAILFDKTTTKKVSNSINEPPKTIG